ncbi:MAG: catechol 2,3-dioxygenase-like lactoylglutathione lyase family enzyme [Candidatus Poriferisodalaceae bacterium]|jgi:catechol 2,3-dioxygenase-like lactoylglutathione lyase family enzyme
MAVHSINAITFRVAEMARSVEFYETLGFELQFGGSSSPFSTLASGECFVNLTSEEDESVESGWGRVIFHVDSLDDVDALHDRAIAGSLTPQHPPRDAPWGERMFAIFDPDGHDLSFAYPSPPTSA